MSNILILIDVVQAIEGPLALNACVVNTQACSLREACSVHEAWGQDLALTAELSQSTFDKLARRGKTLGA